MRADTLRTYKTVHTWTGIVAGLALFIAFYAGALTMFKEPLARWLTPPSQAVRADAARADALVAQLLAARPDARGDFTLHLGEEGRRPHRVQWKPRGAREVLVAELDASGALRIGAPHQTGLPQFIDDVHRTAGLPMDVETGTLVMGLVSALYLLAIVSGVVVLWPTLIKDFFALRVTNNRKRLWLDAHNVIGIASLPFHVVMAWSAVVFGLHDLVYDAQKAVVYGEARFEQIWKSSGPFAAARPDPTPAAALPPSEQLAGVRQRWPDFQPQSLRFLRAGTAGGAVWVTGAQPRHMPRSADGGHVLLGASDGRFLHGEYMAGEQSGWMSAVSSFFSLHFGTYGGATVRWGYFFLGLAGAFLFYSGNLLWIESRRKAERRGDAQAPMQSRATRWMAAGTVGVSLGCVCGLSLAIAAGKWLYLAGGAPADALLRSLYYAAFLAALGWAFARGAARAAPALLWIAAVLCWTIPLASLGGWLAPGSGLWHDAGSAAVDAVALLGGLGFASMARAAARRARQGEADSVWSARGGSVRVGA